MTQSLPSLHAHSPGAPGRLPLNVSGVSHAYGDVRTLSGVSLHVAQGEVVALLGPSGCGKSTLLRLVCGLEPVHEGEIALEGSVVSSRKFTLPPEQRGVGLVFQDFALFPHLSVLENVLFGLETRAHAFRWLGAPVSKSARERAMALLARVGLESRAESPAHALSGGQQQRVALARALAPEPRLLLLDEPFSGLDSALRESVRSETLEVLRESGCAAIIVTHDPEEAMAIADRVVVLNEGKVEHDGTPTSLYFSPRTAFAARFLGALNVFEAHLERSPSAGDDSVHARVGNFSFLLDASRVAESLGAGARLDVIVRPEGVLLEPQPPEGLFSKAPSQGRFLAQARSARWLGHEVLVTLDPLGGLSRPLTARVAGSHWRQLFPKWSEGLQSLPVPVQVRFEPGAVHVFASALAEV